MAAITLPLVGCALGFTGRCGFSNCGALGVGGGVCCGVTFSNPPRAGGVAGGCAGGCAGGVAGGCCGGGGVWADSDVRQKAQRYAATTPAHTGLRTLMRAYL